MIYERVMLKDIDSRFFASEACLRIYLSEENEAVSLRPAMVVCPGGAYEFTSPREAEPVAFRFLAEGFHCFILDYSTKRQYPTPHLELAAVIGYIRENEKKFGLFPDSISVVGFSAGGHLVGSYGYLYRELAKQLGIKEKRLKPRALVLAYPVTLMNKDTHLTTKKMICGQDKGLEEKLDIPSHVDSQYPPTFVWTTKDDDAVPAVNTTKLIEALDKHHVANQWRLYESGWHGSSLVNRSCYAKKDITEKMKEIRDWASLAADFVFDVLDA